MPSGPFAHICLLVKDLDQAITDWTKILGALDPEHLAAPIVRYDNFSGGRDTGMRWATFVANHSTEIQLMQPASGTPLGDRLEKKGEHVHHLCFTTDDVKKAMARLHAENLQVLNDGEVFNDPAMPWQNWAWLGPESAHGVLVEVASPYESLNDAKWHHAPGKFPIGQAGEPST